MRKHQFVEAGDHPPAMSHPGVKRSLTSEAGWWTRPRFEG